jgi:hypothetical protein
MRTCSIMIKQSLINRSKGDDRKEPSNKQRRTFIGGSLAAMLVSPLLVSPQRVMAEETEAPNNPFILLLTGIYQPVVHGPNLGLSAVNLNDGSYSVTRIYPVFGIGNEEGSTDQDKGYRQLLRAVQREFVCLPTPRRRDSDAIQPHQPRQPRQPRFQWHKSPRRERWPVLGRNLRINDITGDRNLSSFPGWSQSHGG